MTALSETEFENCEYASFKASSKLLSSSSLVYTWLSLLSTLLIGWDLSGRSIVASVPKLMIPTWTKLSKLNSFKNATIHVLAPLKNSFWDLAEPDLSRTKIISKGFDEQVLKTDNGLKILVLKSWFPKFDQKLL